ncbi:hypothetical protein SBDP1_30024 [Syntrophobacter sp. SbD1]|nr:hypothetical protein SBDP1_30024 [Syntrophobacter sp. SbD1]
MIYGREQLAAFFDNLTRILFTDCLHRTIITGISDLKGMEKVLVKTTVESAGFDKLFSEGGDHAGMPGKGKSAAQ